MPDTAPFQVTDPIYKDLIEGNRYSVSEVFSSQSASEINMLVNASQGDGGYIVFSPLKVSSQDTLQGFFVFNPTVSDAGTSLDVTKRRLDGPDSSSTASANITYTGGERSNDVLILSGTNKVGTILDEKALIVPSGTDVLFDVASLSGTTNTTMGVEITWSEVPETIIPNLNLQ